MAPKAGGKGAKGGGKEGEGRAGAVTMARILEELKAGEKRKHEEIMTACKTEDDDDGASGDLLYGHLRKLYIYIYMEVKLI